MPNFETWIANEVKATNFHFRLNKGVPGAMQAVTAACQERDHAHIDEAPFEHSPSTLREHGDGASASIFEVTRRSFEGPPVREGATFLIAGFGPGVTEELVMARWIDA